jgi:magnesium-transporting ATPase (P-type)
MLTGDKGLTAKEIGVSCGLLPESKKSNEDVTKNNSEHEEEKKGNLICEFEESTDNAGALEKETDAFIEKVKLYESYQIMISGKVIAIALDADMKSMANLMLSANSVIVYRSSPLQKAEVVKFMKRYTGGKVTLAIGDGANDVNMIQSADVGFGLMGKEGNQAAAFADYACPRFKDLRRALFWHGRGYGVRIQVFVMMVLFKSMLNATTKYSMQFTNGYSGIQPVDNLLISFYNILMTNWFVLFWSIYDQDVSYSKYGTTNKDGSSAEEQLPYKLSEYYAYCREFMNRQRFVRMIILTDFYSVICGFIIFFVYYYGEGVLGA